LIEQAAGWHRTPEDRVDAWRASNPAGGEGHESG
jgi:hypothetical protein